MLLEDIGNYLEQNGIGVLGTDIFLGQLPASPDNVVALFEYAGYPPWLKLSCERPGLQVRVRSTHYTTGRTKIEKVTQVLHGVTEQTINGVRYVIIQAEQSPFPLGRDENGRIEWAVNFTVMKERHFV